MQAWSACRITSSSSTQHRERRWKGPWIDFELKHPVKKPKKRPAKKESSEEAVSRWIKKVEEDREHPQH